MPTITDITTDTLTSLLSHLVRMPTMTRDQATNRAALDWVEEQLHGLPLHIQRLEHNGYPSLVATTRPTKNPRLWLVGHMDVVRANAAGFKPKVHDGKLYGRGSHDMKAGIAVFIALFQELGPRLANYDLGLMLTTDEEIGGYEGVHWLIESKGYRGGAAFMPDSGGGWEMELGAKGIIWWELTATGRSAHASRPWNGFNAIDQLTQFVAEVRSHLKREPCGDDQHWHTTLNLATIQADTATNQVPDLATARVDVRITPDTGLTKVISWFEAAEAKFPAVKAKQLLAAHPYRVKEEGPVALFRDIATRTVGRDISPTLSHGSSDARHFAVHGIPTITVSPVGSGFHVPEEWVDLHELTLYYEATRQFVDEWAARQ
jgi:succinyl-diaminopimelate desuccinylase